MKPQCEREAALWRNVVVDLGAGVVEKAGLRHLEVWELAHEYSEFEQPFEAGMLVCLRDELVREGAGEQQALFAGARIPIMKRR